MPNAPNKSVPRFPADIDPTMRRTVQDLFDRVNFLLGEVERLSKGAPSVAPLETKVGALAVSLQAVQDALATGTAFVGFGNTQAIPIPPTPSAMAIGGPVTSGTPGSVLFIGTGPVLAQDNANFFWDDTNNRLGIDLNSPTTRVDVSGVKNTAGEVGIQLRSGNDTSNFNSNQITFGHDGSTNFRHAIKTRHNSGAQDQNAIDFYTWKQGTDANGTIGTQHVMTIDGNQRVGIRRTDPQAPLSFDDNVGDKVYLYGGGGGDAYGFAVQSNELRMFTGNNTFAIISLGQQAGGSFTERARLAVGAWTVNGLNGTKQEDALISENITLNTGGTTTDSTILLPAGSIILSVTARITTTITTATDWKLGDATISDRFSDANATLTAGTTVIGLNQWKADRTTAGQGPNQATGASVRITTTGTPGAGAIRISIHYIKFTPPTS